MTDSENYNFTERARAVFQIARDVAKQVASDAVSPEHIAVGILREGDGVGVASMRSFGLARREIEAEIMQRLPALSRRAMEKAIELDARAEQLLLDSRTTARELGHPYVGTEHLLLAMLRDNTCIATQILERRGFGIDEAQSRIRWILGGEPLMPGAVTWPPVA